MILTTEPQAETEDGSVPEIQDPVQDLLQRGLFQPASEFLGHRGKRFRAALVELSYWIGGGVAVFPRRLTDAIEMLHAGSLIIDDIEDGSELRRGEQTLHRQVGLPLALNTGNWMYFRALESFVEVPLEEHVRHRMLGISIATIRECHEGQALDLAAKIYEVDQQDVFAVASGIGERKTGALTSLAARLGAIAAGATADHEQALASFGCQLGNCLQMRNDLDELRQVGSSALRCDDMKNARVTWPWAWYATSSSAESFISLQRNAFAATHDPEVAKNLATVIDRQIGEYGDREIEHRLRIAFSKLCTSVGVSKPLRDLQQLLHAISTSATATAPKTRLRDASNLVASRANS